jgi:hypothetical protein
MKYNNEINTEIVLQGGFMPYNISTLCDLWAVETSGLEGEVCVVGLEIAIWPSSHSLHQ